MSRRTVNDILGDIVDQAHLIEDEVRLASSLLAIRKAKVREALRAYIETYLNLREVVSRHNGQGIYGETQSKTIEDVIEDLLNIIIGKKETPKPVKT